MVPNVFEPLKSYVCSIGYASTTKIVKIIIVCHLHTGEKTIKLIEVKNTIYYCRAAYRNR